MDYQPHNFVNKLAEENDGDVMSAEDLEEEQSNQKKNKEKEEVKEELEEQKENIKSVELTGKDATNLNNLSKKPGMLGSANSNNNLTKKKNNNNLSKNLTQRQNSNVNLATDVSNEKGVRHSLNKVAMNLLNHQIVMKLFHFQTEFYGAHKTSDAYLEKFSSTIDKFLEIAQGIYGRLTIKKFKLEGSSHTDDNIIQHIDTIIKLLSEGIDDILDNNTALINVRDELVGDAEQLKYLLTFKPLKI